MSDTPSPWRRLGREHFQRCGTYGAQVWLHKPYDRPGAPRLYRWHVYATEGGSLEGSSAPTLAAAKRAATAALIRHAPMPF